MTVWVRVCVRARLCVHAGWDGPAAAPVPGPAACALQLPRQTKQVPSASFFRRRPVPQALLWARRVRALLVRLPGGRDEASPQQTEMQADLAAATAAALAAQKLEQQQQQQLQQERPAEAAAQAAPSAAEEDAAVRDVVRRRLLDGVAATAQGRLPYELRPPLSEAAALLEEGYILPCDEALFARLLK